LREAVRFIAASPAQAAARNPTSIGDHDGGGGGRRVKIGKHDREAREVCLRRRPDCDGNLVDFDSLMALLDCCKRNEQIALLKWQECGRPRSIAEPGTSGCGRIRVGVAGSTIDG